jgi:hypothetical protein
MPSEPRFRVPEEPKIVLDVTPALVTVNLRVTVDPTPEDVDKFGKSVGQFGEVEKLRELCFAAQVYVNSLSGFEKIHMSSEFVAPLRSALETIEAHMKKLVDEHMDKLASQVFAEENDDAG